MNWLQKIALEPQVGRAQDDFIQLGLAQRGDPEEAMLQVQFANGGGVLNPVVEHAGDIMHRMNDLPTFHNAGITYVKPKVDRVLAALTYGYGFAREAEENIQSNARYKGENADERRRKVDAALKNYADEHRKLPVFNDAQRVAQAIAVAIGERRWEDAISGLRVLKSHLGSAADWKAYAHEGLEGLDEAVEDLREQRRRWDEEDRRKREEPGVDRRGPEVEQEIEEDPLMRLLGSRSTASPNWLQKVASISFSLDDVEKIARRRELPELANEMLGWAYGTRQIGTGAIPKEVVERIMPPNMPYMELIVPDGSYYSGETGSPYTGVINWYVAKTTPGQILRQIPHFARAWFKEEWAGLDFDVEVSEPQESGAWANAYVFRIKIRKNPTSEFTAIDDVNMANETYFRLAGILHLPQEYAGQIPVATLLSRINTYGGDAQISEFVTPPLTPEEQKAKNFIEKIIPGGTHYEAPYDIERFRRYINALKDLCINAIRLGAKTISWG